MINHKAKIYKNLKKKTNINENRYALHIFKTIRAHHLLSRILKLAHTNKIHVYKPSGDAIFGSEAEFINKIVGGTVYY